MSFLTKMQRVAKKLIDKYGDDGLLVENVRGVFDPDSGEYDVYTTKTATKMFIQDFDDSLVVAGVVNMDDLNILCYNVDNRLPTKDWTVEIAGQVLTIIAVNKVITTQNGFITFELQCRK